MTRLLPLPVLGLAAAVAAANSGSVPFVGEGAGARWLGMGGAARAAATDATAGAWNPAGLAGQGPSVWQVGSMLAVETLGRSEAVLAASHVTDRYGTFAAGWLRRSVADLERVNEAGQTSGMETDAEDAFLASWGMALAYQVRVGATAKLLHQSLMGAGATGAAADVGVVVQPWLAEDLRLAATVENGVGMLRWTTGTTDAPAPAVAGAAAWSTWRDRATAAVDVVTRSGAAKPELHAGVEAWPVAGMAAVRAGWNDGRLAIGATYRWLPYQLDYAFTADPSPLGHVHQVSLLLHF